MNSNFRLVINPFAELDLHASFEFMNFSGMDLERILLKKSIVRLSVFKVTHVSLANISETLGKHWLKSSLSLFFFI